MTTDVLQPGAAAGATSVDVTDRPARQLGVVFIDGQPILTTIQEPLSVDAADGTFFVRSAAASTFPVNVGRVGGTATDVNAGNAGAGTQRVVIASDQGELDVALADDAARELGVVSIDSSAAPVDVAEAGLVDTLTDLIEEVRGLRQLLELVTA